MNKKPLPESGLSRISSHWPYVRVMADRMSQDKRLTDAELAAEFHKSTSDFYSANSMHMTFEDAETEQCLSDARDWMFAMERFATLPHYDEPTP